MKQLYRSLVTKGMYLIQTKINLVLKDLGNKISRGIFQQQSIYQICELPSYSGQF